MAQIFIYPYRNLHLEKEAWIKRIDDVDLEMIEFEIECCNSSIDRYKCANDDGYYKSSERVNKFDW